MIRVKKANVERLVSEKDLPFYLKQGYVKVGDSNAETVDEKSDVKELASMTVPELKALAKEKGIEGYSSLTKPELVAILDN